jgi:hypothetical protein
MNIITEPQITQSEFDKFIDTGEIRPSALQRIVKKIIAGQQLDPKEMAVFTSKTSEINKLIKKRESDFRYQVFYPNSKNSNSKL